MTKLSKNDLERRTALIEQLNAAHAALTEAVDDYNETVNDAWSKVDDAQNVYNAALSEAQEWVNDISAQIDDYIGERTDKWREGEKGEAYNNWKSEYDTTLAESDLSQPDELSLDGVENAADTLDQLPTEVEQ